VIEGGFIHHERYANGALREGQRNGCTQLAEGVGQYPRSRTYQKGSWPLSRQRWVFASTFPCASPRGSGLAERKGRRRRVKIGGGNDAQS